MRRVALGMALAVAVSGLTATVALAATPTLQVSSTSYVTLGGELHGNAGLFGGNNPTGTITFRAYGPDDPTCSGPVRYTATRPVVPGTQLYNSGPFVPTQPGVYRWVASYSGDANNDPVTTPCDNPFAVSRVLRRVVPADFDGDGDSDVSVFRPSEGTWYVLGGSPASFAWGAPGDIPVARDYTGDGKVEAAVYRPSDHTWYIRGGSPTAVVWGIDGDVPAPADYDGDGDADIAVFRPSTGTWYLRTPVPQAIAWGKAGDIPVPADYDRDGLADVAVFRPSEGVWYLRLPASHNEAVPWGMEGDIPVPDYWHGEDYAQIAVYRPSTGTWYIPFVGVFEWGQPGDLPAPGDYNGDRYADLAVFRPSTGTWYIRSANEAVPPDPTAVVWGRSGDVPVAFPPGVSLP